MIKFLIILVPITIFLSKNLILTWIILEISTRRQIGQKRPK